jgi:hypothetical protein
MEWSRHFAGIHPRSVEPGMHRRDGGLTDPTSVSVGGERSQADTVRVVVRQSGPKRLAASALFSR